MNWAKVAYGSHGTNRKHAGNVDGVSDSEQQSRPFSMETIMRTPQWTLFFVLLVLAGCARNSTPVQTNASSINLSQRATGDASVESWSTHLAFDDDVESFWNAQREAPAWISFSFDSLYLVDRLELVVSQHQAGPTTHEIWLADDSHTLSLYKRLENIETEDSAVLDVTIDPPRPINKVFVLTSQSQGWVAWREIRVFGTLDPNRWILKKLGTGLEFPVQITHAGDGSGRLFVIEKTGRIRIMREGLIGETPFLDITDRTFSEGLEQGLLSIAFPPSYTERQHFYVSYTDANEDTVISRFATSNDPDMADPNSEEILLTIDQPWNTHNGGAMAFGPQDGYLYIGSGDGGLTDPDYSEATAGIFLGKVLRIDVESDAKPYGIPPDNPFNQVPDYRPEIWALGLRNPWGFAFDSQTGDLYIPDVGSGDQEELNFQSSNSEGGEHYGWPFWEGSYCYEDPQLACRLDNLAFPVSSYHHGDGCAIVGGAVHQGVFYYADFCRGRIWGLQRQGEGWKNELLISWSTVISSIGIDEEGKLYATGFSDGSIYALVRQTEYN
jgi:glucose/arabinose dehydrogenase